MGSSSSKLYGTLIVLAYVASFFLTATSVVAAPEMGQAATPDLVAAQQDGSETLKLHGSPRLNLDQNADSPLTDVQDEASDLGDTTEWEDPLNDIAGGSFETVHLQPAYDKTSAIDGGINNLAVGLQGQYHPTWWMPDTLAPNPGGSGNGLWDANDDAIMDYRQVDDEDFDSGIDNDKTDDEIDLAGENDNIPDTYVRNTDASQGDIYHPAMVWAYEWTGYSSSHSQTNIAQGDDLVLPLAGMGGDPGWNSVAAHSSEDPTNIEIDTASNGNDGSGTDNDEWIRLETEQINVAAGETVEAWDFQVKVESVDDTSGAGEDTSRVRVFWLGDYDNPDEVGSGTITVDPDDLVGGERTTRQIDSDDSCTNADKPTDTSARFFYFCVDTVTPGSPGNIGIRLGRVITDRANNAEIASILANGAYYSVADLRLEDTNDDTGSAGEADEDDAIEVLRIEQVVPLGDDVEFEGLDATLKGVAAGSDFAFPHPFDSEHTYLQDIDAEPDTNNHEFMRDVDSGQRGEGDDIDADDIDLTEDFEDPGDRDTETRSALSLSWAREGRESGLLAHRLDPNGAYDDFTFSFNNVYPNHYVELNLDEKAVVQSHLASALEGFRFFVWDPAADNEVMFGHSARLFGEDLNDANGDTINPAPAFDNEGDTEAGGDPANTLVELGILFDPNKVYDDDDDDGNVDFNVETDEELDDENKMDDTDGDDVKDEDHNNLFDIVDPNTQIEEGDLHAPSVRQDYTYRWIDSGTDNPTTATVNSDVLSAIGSGTSKLVLSSASANDGSGLSTADIDGDGEDDETFVAARETGQEIDNDGASGAESDGGETGFELVRFESEQVALEAGDRATLFGFDLAVTGVDDDNDQANLKIYMNDEAQETSDDVATFNNVGTTNNHVGVAMDWQSGRTASVGPQSGLGSGVDPDFDFGAQVVSVSGTTVNVILFHYVPVGTGTTFFADGHMYALTGTNMNSATEMEDFTLTTWTPLGDDVQVTNPDVTIEGLQSGGMLSVLAPFNADHSVVDQHNTPTDEDEDGFLTSTTPDDDDDFDNRILDVGPLEITVGDWGSWDNSFIWLDSTEVDGTGQQIVNGIFDGETDWDQGGATDAGFPAPAGSWDDVPDTSADSGISHNLAAGFDDPIPNAQRGTLGFVDLTLPDAQGTYLQVSGRLGADLDNSAGIETLQWLSSDADRVDDSGSTGWFAFANSEVEDLWVGDGSGPTVDACLEDPTSDACQPGGSANIVVVDLTCSPSTVTQLEAVTCTATVENQGTAEGRDDVDLMEGNSVLATKNTGTMAAGASKTVTLTWQTTTATTVGDHMLTAGSQSATVTIEEADSGGTPDISVQSCGVSGEIKLGSSVSASVTFINNGDAAGSETANIAVDGTNVASVGSGTVAAGATVTRTAQVQITAQHVTMPDASGDEAPSTSVAITAGGVDCGTITVTGDAPAQKPTIPGFQTAALVAAMGAALVLLRRD